MVARQEKLGTVKSWLSLLEFTSAPLMFFLSNSTPVSIIILKACQNISKLHKTSKRWTLIILYNISDTKHIKWLRIQNILGTSYQHLRQLSLDLRLVLEKEKINVWKKALTCCACFAHCFSSSLIGGTEIMSSPRSCRDELGPSTGLSIPQVYLLYIYKTMVLGI